MNFDQCFDRLIGHAGGHVNDPRDPGGATNLGISRRAYPGEDIAGMTIERAKLLYRRDYWGPAGCDGAPDAVKLHLFELAVNSGVRAAIKAVQRAVHEVEDGVLGSATLQAMQSMPPLRLVARITGAGLQAFRQIEI